jgi:signal transduction histidine kinase
VIRDNAHLALQDLREVIGVLRARVGELPQPTLADVAQLVAESGRAGMGVGLGEELGGVVVPALVGRTAYRVVQEGLTNARKHAPGAAVRVRVAGAPGQGLTVEVCNHAPNPGSRPAPDPDPGSGLGDVRAGGAGRGLVGLAERVGLVDGRLEHGPTAAGGWRLAAWLPWPP